MVKLMVILEATMGGIRKHVVDLLTGLERDQFEVTFVFSKERADQIFPLQLPLLISKGIRLIELPMCRNISIIKDVKALMRLIGILRQYPPDILHLHGAKGGALGRAAARILGIKNVIYNPHGGSFHKFQGLMGRFYLAVEQVLTVTQTQFIGVSADSCKNIEQFLKVKKENISKIYNGLDLVPLTDQTDGAIDFKKSHGIEDSKFVVLYPAVFLESKGHLDFIEGLNSVKSHLGESLLIILAGDGPLRSKIEKTINAYGLNKYFKLLGFVNDLSVVYKACALVMLPSRNEVFGYVLLEAMSYSKAVMATAVGGIPEIVIHGHNGELFDSDDLKAMALRILEISKDDVLLKRYESNARRRVAEFTKESMVNQTKDLYRRMLSGGYPEHRGNFK